MSSVFTGLQHIAASSRVLERVPDFASHLRKANDKIAALLRLANEEEEEAPDHGQACDPTPSSAAQSTASRPGTQSSSPRPPVRPAAPGSDARLSSQQGQGRSHAGISDSSPPDDLSARWYDDAVRPVRTSPRSLQSPPHPLGYHLVTNEQLGPAVTRSGTWEASTGLTTGNAMAPLLAGTDLRALEPPGAQYSIAAPAVVPVTTSPSFVSASMPFTDPFYGTVAANSRGPQVPITSTFDLALAAPAGRLPSSSSFPQLSISHPRAQLAVPASYAFQEATYGRR